MQMAGPQCDTPLVDHVMTHDAYSQGSSKCDQQRTLNFTISGHNLRMHFYLAGEKFLAPGYYLF
jgi:hypothetical protein